MQTGDASFQRGQRYFQSDTIFDTRRQGMTLKGRCQGSRPIAYRVEVTFHDTKIIEDTACSCPFGSFCKHVAALLLTWLAHPEKFLEEPDMETVLQQCDKNELIALIKQMVRREPDLETLVLTMGPADTTADPELYRRQVEAAFRNRSNAWGAVGEIADELFAIMETADGFAKGQRYASAIVAYGEIAKGIIAHYDEYEELEDFGLVINDCVTELQKCFTEVSGDRALREQILQVLFAIRRFDNETGGIGLGERANSVLVEQTTDEERKIIAGWEGEAITKPKNTPK